MGNAVPTRRGVGGGSSPDAAARATGTRVGATPGGGTQGRVCVAGPVFLDVVMGGLQHAPRPGEEQWVSDCAVMPGGAANQAVALARLGAPTSLVTHLGEDDAGRLVQTMLERDGIDLSGAVRLPRQSVTTSLAFGGDRAMTTFGTDATPPLADLAAVPTCLVCDLRAVRDNRDTLMRWRGEGRSPWVLADVGWDPTGRWDPHDLDVLDLVDVFTPNEAEALHYTRTPDASSAARALGERVGTVLLTRGARGVLARTPTEEVELPVVPVPAVDTTGAGDTFSAGFVWAHLHDLPLRAALTTAALAASYTVGRPGGSASSPTLAELACWTRAQDLPQGYDTEFLDLTDGVGERPRG